MPEINATSIQDCMTIARAFERGANHAMTEESVFAVMTPRLSTMRSVSKTTKKQMSKKDTKSPALLGLTSGDADAIDLLKECFPCKFRIDFKGKMSISQLLNPAGLISDPIIGALKDFYTRALNEINQMMDMFRNLDKYVDLCAFKKFFMEFVCIPDLSRIIALLTAFLMKLALELNGIFSLVISLFAPLLMPFLAGLVDQLTQFILAAIKPIECIIENIQKMLTKLDYNVLFENVSQNNLGGLNEVFPHVATKNTAQQKSKGIKIPLFESLEGISVTPGGKPGQKQNVVVGNKAGQAGSTSVLNNPTLTKAEPSAPVSSTGGTALLNKDNSKVQQAEDDLKALQEASLHIDGADQAAADTNRAQITKAKENLAQAQKERDLSAIGRANQGLTEKFGAMKGSLISMLSMLRRAAVEIEAYIRKVLDELIKLIREFFGGGVSALNLLADKLQIVQLIALVVAIIKALKNKPNCEDEGQENETFLNQLNTADGFTLFTDTDGTLHIQEKDDGIKRAIEDVAAVFGVPAGGDPRDKLKSLVKFTGNDTLDSSISRAVDGLTTPTRVKFKCPLQTSVAKAETVNKWIRELNSESV